MNYKDKTLKFIGGALLVGAIFLFGVYTGFKHRPSIEKITGISHKEPTAEVTPGTDFEPFWKVWATLQEKYPHSDKISDQDKVWGAIGGLVNSYNDPYTSFFNPKENKLFEESLEGSFSGVGMEVGMKEKILTVIAPLKNTPAYTAGIKAGDKILKIGDTVTSNLTIDEAITLIRGDKGTTVKLKIFRDGEDTPREFQIVRDTISIPTLDTEARPDGIFVIRLYNFSSNSSSLFAGALKEFEKSGDHKLLLDLRGNPGGYLDAAVDMASYFLPEGKPVVKPGSRT